MKAFGGGSIPGSLGLNAVKSYFVPTQLGLQVVPEVFKGPDASYLDFCSFKVFSVNTDAFQKAVCLASTVLAATRHGQQPQLID